MTIETINFIASNTRITDSGNIELVAFGCKTCAHKVDKNKKDQVEPRKYEFKDKSTYEAPQSIYINQKCDVKGNTLKFGIMECPNYEVKK